MDVPANCRKRENRKAFQPLTKKSTLHGGRLGISWSHPESEGKLQAEPIEERGLGRVRPDEAPEPQFPALGGREGHIRALDAVSE